MFRFVHTHTSTRSTDDVFDVQVNLYDVVEKKKLLKKLNLEEDKVGGVLGRFKYKKKRYMVTMENASEATQIVNLRNEEDEDAQKAEAAASDADSKKEAKASKGLAEEASDEEILEFFDPEEENRKQKEVQLLEAQKNRQKQGAVDFTNTQAIRRAATLQMANLRVGNSVNQRNNLFK